MDGKILGASQAARDLPGGLGGLPNLSVFGALGQGDPPACCERQGGQVGDPWGVGTPSGHVHQILEGQTRLLH
jgi:hypothetical protein